MKTLLIVCFLTILVTSCASQKTGRVDLLATFIGKPIDAARSELGKPYSVYDMQNGTFEYIWKKRMGDAVSGSSFMGVQVASSDPRTCNRVLITNQSKTVIAFRYEGKC